MTGDQAEIIAAVVAVIILFGAIGRSWAWLVSKLSNHEIRITSGETIAEHTARILERSSLQLAAIEERTKHL